MAATAAADAATLKRPRAVHAHSCCSSRNKKPRVGSEALTHVETAFASTGSAPSDSSRIDTHTSGNCTTALTRTLARYTRARTPEQERVLRRLQTLWRGASEAMMPTRPRTLAPPDSLVFASVSPSAATAPAARAAVWHLHDLRALNGSRSHGDGTEPSHGPTDSVATQTATPATARTPSSVATSASAAARVLALPMLWRAITACMSGLPFAVVAFAQQSMERHGVERSAWTSPALESSHSTTTAASTAAPPPVYRSRVFFDLDACDPNHTDGSDGAFLRSRDGLLLHLAIADGDERVLRLLLAVRQSAPHYRSDPRLRVDRALQCAITYKRWRLLPWLARALPANDPAWQWEPNLMQLAVAQHNAALMDWLVRVCPDASVSLSARRMEVCASSDLALVTWLHAHGYAPFSVWMMNGAAAQGALDVVQFLHAHRSEGCSTHAMDLAARYGHLTVVQFLHAHRSEGCTSKALDGAAQNGHIAVVQFLLVHRRDACDVASAKRFALMHDQRGVVACLDAFCPT